MRTWRGALVAFAVTAGCGSEPSDAGERGDPQGSGDGAADVASAGTAGVAGVDASAGVAGAAGSSGTAGLAGTGGWGRTGGAGAMAGAGGVVPDAPYDGPMCEFLEVPVPTGYDLASYDGGIDGLCDAAESIGCWCVEFPTWTIECAPDGSVCAGTDVCSGGLGRCGWIDCGFGNPACEDMTPAIEEAYQRGDSRACASDLHCPITGQTCKLRLGDRMFCSPPQFGSDAGVD